MEEKKKVEEKKVEEKKVEEKKVEQKKVEEKKVEAKVEKKEEKVNFHPLGGAWLRSLLFEFWVSRSQQIFF